MIFLILYANTQQDLAITDRPYTFKQLNFTQALADAEVLEHEKERPLWWIQLNHPVLESLQSLAESM